jgi:prevent-host-death family protein
MRSVRISEDFVPISEFKAQAADWLRKIGETGAPVVVTQNGKPAGVLLSPEAFDQLTEQARFMSAVNEGLADAEAGRVHSHVEVVKRMKDRFGAKRR